jgi:hypothetical protein
MKHFILLLGSLTVVAGAGLAATSSGWVTMVDPREQAFSIDVPQGWKAYGGMFRSNAVDTRPFIDMTSPDSKMNIRIGDASIPSYHLPNVRLEMMQKMQNLRMRARLGNRSAASRFVAPYATGDEFAAKYGAQRFQSLCQNVQVAKTGQSEPAWGRGVRGTRITAGWAGFTCTQNGQQMSAYVYAETLEVLPTFGSTGKWYVISLGSTIAPNDRKKEAGDLLAHSFKSVAMNPAWIQAQRQRISMATQQVIAGSEASTQVYNQASASYQRNMHMQAQEVDNFNDVQMGQTYARTANGQTYVVPAGHGGTQWVDPLGSVKESALVPGPGYSQLQTISR